MYKHKDEYPRNHKIELEGGRGEFCYLETLYVQQCWVNKYKHEDGYPRDHKTELEWGKRVTILELKTNWPTSKKATTNKQSVGHEEYIFSSSCFWFGWSHNHGRFPIPFIILTFSSCYIFIIYINPNHRKHKLWYFSPPWYLISECTFIVAEKSRHQTEQGAGQVDQKQVEIGKIFTLYGHLKLDIIVMW